MRAIKIAFSCFVVVFGILVVVELQTSFFQSLYFSKIAGSCAYQVKSGRGNIVFPEHGPTDERLGYTDIPKIVNKLTSWEVLSQASWAPGMVSLAKKGIFTPYEEKQFTGLSINGSSGEKIYKVARPGNVYKTYEEIPNILIKALLFVESAEMLSGGKRKNVVVEWDRLTLNSVNLIAHKMGFNVKVSGASTLATQMEKYEHSPGGKTVTVKDKINQMMSASIRLYKDGVYTEKSRKRIVQRYINSVPLGSIKGSGEVIGIGDGLKYWFGRNFSDANSALRYRDPKVFKEILALVISVRRPNYYLKNPKELNSLVNSYIRLMSQKGAIELHLFLGALEHSINFSKNVEVVENIDKNLLTIKRNLMSLLSKESYAINTMDLMATSTINKVVQENVVKALSNLDKKKITGDKLLTAQNNLSNLNYSFSLYEAVGQNNLLRVQVDSSKDEFNLNDSSKLELGSTAKLRTLITYLDLVAEMYITKEFYDDPLSQWVSVQDAETLEELMEKALLRKVSGSPAEGFYTGSGLHYFHNFEGKYNGISTVREGLQKSINLVFIRLMKDIISYLKARNPDFELVLDHSSNKRKEYIKKFIRLEAMTYLNKFVARHKNLTQEQSFQLLASRVPKFPFRQATLFRTVYPKKSFDEFKTFIGKVNKPQELYEKYAYGNFNWQDMGYITRLHPLELWLIAGRKENLDEVIEQSYKWIWSERKVRAQDRGIAQILEIQAFEKLLPYWKKLGYPFKRLVPSLATAIGSSGDNPTALSELIGIIIREGKYCPNRRFTNLSFAVETPYETNLLVKEGVCKPVLLPMVAKAARSAIRDVVEKGTAIRIKNVFKDKNGIPLEVGGKTGTGDNRVKKTNKVLNRTGTFTFHIGGKFFGALTLFVQGKEANKFKFTSSLPLQFLKMISPELEPMIQESL